MKEEIKKLFVKFGGANLLLAMNRHPRVLCFHGIDYIKDNLIEAESLSVELFRQQIEFLKKNFDIISIDEFYTKFRLHKLTSRDIVITFDDGYESIYRVVAPLLNKDNIPYTIFVSTHNITTGELFATSINRLIVLASSIKEIRIPSLGICESLDAFYDRYKLAQRISKLLKESEISVVETIVSELLGNLSIEEFELLVKQYPSVKPMNWAQVKFLSEYKNVTIGSHCCRHICCHNRQKMNIVEDEILNSKKTIEEKLGIDCNFFAYPNGNYTEKSNEIVKRGYCLGFSIVSEERIDYTNDISMIPRIYVFGNDIETFKYLCTRYPMN